MTTHAHTEDDRHRTHPRPLAELLAATPAATARQGSAGQIRSTNRKRDTWLVVLDDDPTGTQSMDEVPVLLAWDQERLDEAAVKDEVTFVLTNTRSHTPEETASRVESIVSMAVDASMRRDRDLRIVLRGDSTLRGHHPLEADTATAALSNKGVRVDGVLIVPAFPEAGRITVDDTHWVCHGDVCTPVGDTEFARDATFGFTASNLREWAAEKESTTADRVASISLTRTRLEGPDAVTDVLTSVPVGGTVVADAATAEDLLTLSQGLQGAERAGRHFLVRCAPAFVRARAGTPVPTRVAPLEPQRERRAGIVVVGSHTGVTSRQLERASEATDLWVGELDAVQLAHHGLTNATDKVLSEAANELAHGRNVAIQTSRTLVRSDDPAESLDLARRVSDALCAAVNQLCRLSAPGWVVAKGGITSADVAVKALSASRATVHGPMTAQGISLWSLDEDALIPRLPYVVFPGNVGDDDALVQVLRVLEGAPAC
jgi:uncharacterized protein YgbK (DUF1537 family)